MPTLAEVLRLFWRGRWIIALATSGGCVTASGLAFVTPSTYRSEVLVQPRQATPSNPGLAAITTQLGGFTELAGLTLGGGGDKAVALATLRSRGLIQRFLEEKALLKDLFESRWDNDNSRWRGEPPTVWEAYNTFTSSILKISEDKRTGLVTIAIEWRNPEQAQAWASELVARTNALLKTAAIEEGEKNLAYLQEQANKIGQVELQQSLYALVESEMKKLMIARGTDEYALRTIDAAVVPKKRLRPNRLAAAAIGLALGALFGCAVVLGLEQLRGR